MIKTLALVSWWAISFAIDAPNSLSMDQPKLDILNQAEMPKHALQKREGATKNGVSNTAELKQQLETVLRPRRPSEFAFINLVIQRIDNNTLPRSLVEGTLLWARKHETHTFQYFEAGLRRRAAAIGIQL